MMFQIWLIGSIGPKGTKQHSIVFFLNGMLQFDHLSHEKKTNDFPWLFNRDPCNGLLIPT